jgi:predicted DNA-binding transcriptional regulator AlpA
MTMVFRNIERARKEVAQLHGELLRLENGVNLVRESLGKAITELFGTDRQAFPALRESALAARVAEAVLSRLPDHAQDATARKRFVREREAASYMGISVATLRRWRTLRSKTGPAFTRLGRMVMYSMTTLEDHMRAGVVPHRSS